MNLFFGITKAILQVQFLTKLGPEKPQQAVLQSTHDEIIDMQNKRFSHNDEHSSISNALVVDFHGNRFELKFGLSLGYYIGRTNEWPHLVSSVEALFLERIQKLPARLKQKMGIQFHETKICKNQRIAHLFAIYIAHQSELRPLRAKICHWFLGRSPRRQRPL